ncbi:MAG: YihY/virulence factor BrkB family protein [Deltaproteobacteria bacterium]|nr:YihY/virulence factor BrkB family protein [Deltaproteobacteria bacterium]
MEKIREGFHTAWFLTKETLGAWWSDKAPRLGAALSYYTIFALAPVLILVIAVAGMVLGREAAQGEIVTQLRGLLGEEGAVFVQDMILNSSEKKSGIIATGIGIITLLIGATGVFIELQDALNTVWKVEAKTGRGFKGLLRDRLLSFGLVLSLGFLLLVSLAMSAGLSALGGWISRFIPGWVMVGYVINFGVSIGVVALLLAVIFKLLPDVKMAWRDVWMGSIVTAVLFTGGKYVIGLYLGKASVGSPFGAAGSLAILLVWIYYTAQIILLGAEFTRAYANRCGSHGVGLEPAHNQEALPSGRSARGRPTIKVVPSLSVDSTRTLP